MVGDKRSGGGCTVPAGLPLTSNTEGLWTPSLDFSQGLFHRRSEGLNNPDSYLLRAALSSPFHHCCQILGTWDLSSVSFVLGSLTEQEAQRSSAAFTSQSSVAVLWKALLGIACRRRCATRSLALSTGFWWRFSVPSWHLPVFLPSLQGNLLFFPCCLHLCLVLPTLNQTLNTQPR